MLVAKDIMTTQVICINKNTREYKDTGSTAYKKLYAFDNNLPGKCISFCSCGCCKWAMYNGCKYFPYYSVIIIIKTLFRKGKPCNFPPNNKHDQHLNYLSYLANVKYAFPICNISPYCYHIEQSLFLCSLSIWIISVYDLLTFVE